MLLFKDPALAINLAEIAALLPNAEAAAAYILLSNAPVLFLSAPITDLALSIVDLVSASPSSSTSSKPNENGAGSIPKPLTIDSIVMFASCALRLSKPPVNTLDSIVIISDSSVAVTLSI